MSEPPILYEIVFESDVSRMVNRYVNRQFFTLREIPQAIWRMLFIREFVLYVVLPFLVTLAGIFAPVGALALQVIGVTWMVLGVIGLLRLGRQSAIGCFETNKDGSRGPIAGGLRLMVSKQTRTIWLVGVMVEFNHRGRGMFGAFLLSVFKMARHASKEGPVNIALFGPAHPASKRIMEKYCAGKRILPVDLSPDSTFSESLEMLIREVEGRDGVTYTESIQYVEGDIFGG